MKVLSGVSFPKPPPLGHAGPFFNGKQDADKKSSTFLYSDIIAMKLDVLHNTLIVLYSENLLVAWDL